MFLESGMCLEFYLRQIRNKIFFYLSILIFSYISFNFLYLLDASSHSLHLYKKVCPSFHQSGPHSLKISRHTPTHTPINWLTLVVPAPVPPITAFWFFFIRLNKNCLNDVLCLHLAFHWHHFFLSLSLSLSFSLSLSLVMIVSTLPWSSRCLFLFWGHVWISRCLSVHLSAHPYAPPQPFRPLWGQKSAFSRPKSAHWGQKLAFPIRSFLSQIQTLLHEPKISFFGEWPQRGQWAILSHRGILSFSFVLPPIQIQASRPKS